MITSDLGFMDLASYLKRTGWRRIQGGPLAEVWHPSDDASHTVLVPKTEKSPDFERTVKILTEEVARIENRPPETVREDISRQFLDVTDFRADDGDVDHGTIPLSSGIELFNSAQSLIVSAAAATINRQGYYGRSLPRAAYDHARGLRLGQTRPGSYVVPIISSARFNQVRDYKEEPPQLEIQSEDSYFDRRVLTTLSRSLETLANLIVNREHTPSPSEVRESVSEGVSSELCSAVLSVIDDESIGLFDITFNWAPASPAPETLKSKVAFTKEATFLINKVKETLSQTEEPKEHVLYGVIRKLSRGANEKIGRVTLETIIDGRPRSVSFDLNLEDYQRATQYHGERRRVVVTGVLHAPPGRPASMKAKSITADPSIPTLND